MSLDDLRGRGSETLSMVGLFSAEDLLAGNIIPQAGLDNPEVYSELGRKKMIIQSGVAGGQNQVQVTGFPLRGMEINSMLHYAASEKLLGLDTNDVIMDWTAIGQPENRERLLRHATKYVKPENWNMYDKIRPTLLNLIQEWWESDIQVGNVGSVVPVATLKQNEQGKYEWSFDQPQMSDRNIYMPYLGPLLVAAYSPDVTLQWPKIHKGQSMGSTQILPMTLEWRESLLKARLVKNLIALSQGELPVNLDPGTGRNQNINTDQYL